MKPAMTEAPSLEGRRGMIASVATTGTLAPSRSAAEQHSLGWFSPFIRILRGLGLVGVSLMLM